MRILIAEKDARCVSKLVRMIEAGGQHECVLATNEHEAWHAAGRDDLDVVITASRIGGISGIELASHLRHIGSHVYVMLLTAAGEHAELMRAIAAGVDDFLARPVDPDHLRIRLTAADRVLALHRRIRAQQSEIDLIKERMAAMARTDTLTQLPNRIRLSEDLAILSANAQRYDYTCAFVLCDVDEFRSYNDRNGHASGDHLLRRIAETINSACRSGDRAYRYGGDEFLLLLPEQSAESAMVAVDRVRREIERLVIPFIANAESGIVTISAGIAMLGCGKTRCEDVLHDADVALSSAKQLGGNRVQVFDDVMLDDTLLSLT